MSDYPNIVYVNKQPFYDIANSIREKLDLDNNRLIKPDEMPGLIGTISFCPVMDNIFYYGGAFIQPNNCENMINMFNASNQYFYLRNNVKYIENFASGRNTYSNPQCPDSVISLNNAYHITSFISGKPYLLHPSCGNNVIYMDNAYSSSKFIFKENNEIDINNKKNAVCGDNVKYMNSAYYNCYWVGNAVCGDNVLYMCYAYAYCNSITYAVCGDNVISMEHAYTGCTNLVKAACGNKVQGLSYAFSGCTNLIYPPVLSRTVTTAFGAFSGCTNLIYPPDSLYEINQSNNMFRNCFNLKYGIFGVNMRLDQSYMYENCYSINDLGMVYIGNAHKGVGFFNFSENRNYFIENTKAKYLTVKTVASGEYVVPSIEGNGWYNALANTNLENIIFYYSNCYGVDAGYIFEQDNRGLTNRSIAFIFNNCDALFRNNYNIDNRSGGEKLNNIFFRITWNNTKVFIKNNSYDDILDYIDSNRFVKNTNFVKTNISFTCDKINFDDSYEEGIFEKIDYNFNCIEDFMYINDANSHIYLVGD